MVFGTKKWFLLSCFIIYFIGVGSANAQAGGGCKEEAISKARIYIKNSISYKKDGNLEEALREADLGFRVCEEYIPAGMNYASLLIEYGDKNSALNVLDKIAKGYPELGRQAVAAKKSELLRSSSRFTFELWGPSGTLQSYSVNLVLSGKNLSSSDEALLRIIEEDYTQTPNLPQLVKTMFVPTGYISMKVYTDDKRYPCQGIGEADSDLGLLIGEYTWDAKEGSVEQVEIQMDCGKGSNILTYVLVGLGGMLFR